MSALVLAQEQTYSGFDRFALNPHDDSENDKDGFVPITGSVISFGNKESFFVRILKKIF
ncbi:MAG: hypothetical protein U9Q69_06060 [Nanoarchaeota archaeon]|nr:hypothetical protein [Nanoarchaeota archaeon]